jgi:hypothetical protein
MVVLGATLVALGSALIVSGIISMLRRSQKHATGEAPKVQALPRAVELGSHHREKAAWLLQQLQEERAGTNEG